MLPFAAGRADRQDSNAGLAVLVSFLYGFLAVAFLFMLPDRVLGQHTERLTVVVLHAAAMPIALLTGYVEFVDRRELVPFVVVTGLLGGWVVSVVLEIMGSTPESIDALSLVAVGFGVAWAGLGFAAGTAMRWWHRDAVPWRDLVITCLGVLGAGFVVHTSFLLGSFLSNMGEQLG